MNTRLRTTLITPFALALLLVGTSVPNTVALPRSFSTCNRAGDPPDCAACSLEGERLICQAVCIGLGRTCEITPDGNACSVVAGSYGDCVTGMGPIGDAIGEGVSFDPHFNSTDIMASMDLSGISELQLYY